MHLTDEQYRLISHSLGVKENAKKLPKEYYRNYFQVEGGDNYDEFLKMCEKGLATTRKQFDQTVFHVLDKGIKLFEQSFKNKQ